MPAKKVFIHAQAPQNRTTVHKPPPYGPEGYTGRRRHPAVRPEPVDKTGSRQRFSTRACPNLGTLPR